MEHTNEVIYDIHLLGAVAAGLVRGVYVDTLDNIVEILLVVLLVAFCAICPTLEHLLPTALCALGRSTFGAHAPIMLAIIRLFKI